ncbi:dol-P-Man:Man(7)GlcNAc(2)-PP-Dol alpha-1,6-mannosyltransferase-like [Watersipora subatra]|uniref:dol-P-Man:Man(7)GlcNAc(2)-PP-Dol alpha-1,6-mannosyltransferase-like n=1 Tax=Watersipora subatra TaxID=2589382 RepID=UPI00355BA394
MLPGAVLASWLLCVSTSTLYLYFCPFTKVEESFNLQAVHDHIYYGYNLSQFDHIEFPGPLPRTFIGSLIVGYTSMPISLLFAHIPKLYTQYAARLMLMMLVMLSYLHFLSSVKKLYGSAVAVWSCLLLSSQFHFLFYASRTLPNTFALIFALLAVSCWLRSWHRGFVFSAGFAIIVFRCELLLLFGLMLLISLIYGRLNVWRLLFWIVAAGSISLGSTLLIDSYYWQQLVWPEAWAFYFNAVLNKSSEWGTSPFFWYFYSALPRAMGMSLAIVPLGMVLDRRCLVMAAPSFGFLFLYSFLPHKELRFILYVVPVLNVAAARACSVVWNNKYKSLLMGLMTLAVVGHLLVNVLMTSFLLKLSYHNYPGGRALQYLNSLPNPNKELTVHIDIYAAQTGVSRFLHEHKGWRYDKSEDMVKVKKEISSYDYLLIGTPDEPEIDTIVQQYSLTHNAVHSVLCYKSIHLTKEYPFIDVNLAPCIWLFKLRH